MDGVYEDFDETLDDFGSKYQCPDDALDGVLDEV
jgi:hypothetical protein